MARNDGIRYADWSSDTYNLPVDWSGSSTSSSIYINSSTTASANTYWLPLVVYRRFAVPRPEGWTFAEEVEFARVINEETDGSWLVEMIVDGNVLITDPRIEKRELCDLLPLMYRTMTKADAAKIRAYVAAHPLDAPTPESEVK